LPTVRGEVEVDRNVFQQVYRIGRLHSVHNDKVPCCPQAVAVLGVVFTNRREDGTR
jgi:hypothetical protein